MFTKVCLNLANVMIFINLKLSRYQKVVHQFWFDINYYYRNDLISLSLFASFQSYPSYRSFFLCFIIFYWSHFPHRPSTYCNKYRFSAFVDTDIFQKEWKKVWYTDFKLMVFTIIEICIIFCTLVIIWIITQWSFNN